MWMSVSVLGILEYCTYLLFARRSFSRWSFTFTFCPSRSRCKTTTPLGLSSTLFPSCYPTDMNQRDYVKEDFKSIVQRNNTYTYISFSDVSPILSQKLKDLNIKAWLKKTTFLCSISALFWLWISFEYVSRRYNIIIWSLSAKNVNSVVTMKLVSYNHLNPLGFYLCKSSSVFHDYYSCVSVWLCVTVHLFLFSLLTLLHFFVTC